MTRHLGIIVVSVAMLLGLAALPTTAATPFVASWRATLGSGAFNGYATLATDAAGTGSLRLVAKHLVARIAYPVELRIGSCTGTRIAAFASAISSSTGTIIRTSAMSAAQAATVVSSATRLFIRIGSSTRVRCGSLEVVAFAPVALSGDGSAVPRFAIPVGATAIAAVAYTGDGNFSIFTLAADGSSIDLLVNVIGSYTGTVLFDARHSTHSVAFKIEASGQWTVTISAVSTARAWNGTGTLTGTGDDVVRVVPSISGLASANINNQGTDNFIVWALGPSYPDLLVNQIGVYSGEVQLPKGTNVLEINSDGPWTVARS